MIITHGGQNHRAEISQRSTLGRTAPVFEPRPSPICRGLAEVRLFQSGVDCAIAHVIANNPSAQREHVDVRPGCDRGAFKRRLSADKVHDGGKGRSYDQQRRGGRVRTWHDASSTGMEVRSLRGGNAGPRSHSSTILWLVSSSTIFERLFHGMKGEKVDLRKGLDTKIPSIDEALWLLISGILRPTGASGLGVLRSGVPTMIKAATISIADRMRLIPTSRMPTFLGLVCRD